MSLHAVARDERRGTDDAAARPHVMAAAPDRPRRTVGRGETSAVPMEMSRSCQKPRSRERKKLRDGGYGVISVPR